MDKYEWNVLLPLCAILRNVLVGLSDMKIFRPPLRRPKLLSPPPLYLAPTPPSPADSTLTGVIMDRNYVERARSGLLGVE